MSSIDPGWYRDPAEPDTQRYWDGEQWIGKPLPVDAEPPEGPPEPEPEPEPVLPPPGRPGYVDPDWAPPPAGVTPIDRRPPPGGWRQPPGEPGTPRAGFPFAQVDLKGQTVASPGLRLVARLIDVVAVLLLNAVVNGYFVYQYFQEVMPQIMSAAENGRTIGPDDISDRAANLQMIITFVALLLWFAYEVPSTANSGQTLGKKMVGIKVAPLYGQPLKMFPMALRWSTMALPFLFIYCGFILLIADALACLRADRPYRQCLHDKFPATTVVLSTDPVHTPEGDADVPPSDPR